MNWWISFALDEAIWIPSYPASRAHAALRPNASARSRISLVDRTWIGTPRSAGRTWTGVAAGADGAGCCGVGGVGVEDRTQHSGSAAVIFTAG